VAENKVTSLTVLFTFFSMHNFKGMQEQM